MGIINVYLNGAIFTAAVISALYFFRFYRDYKDRFFLLFSLAFVLLGIERLPWLVNMYIQESHGSVYVVRLFAYLLILSAIVYKNRSSVKS